ncbi:hypothetical protein WMY93_034128, partial [Mugilogobius chulae]
CKGEDTMSQPAGDVLLTQGQTANIQCNYKTNDGFPYLFWYKQEGRGAPEYMMKLFGESTVKSPEFDKDRFHAELKKTSLSLIIQDVDVTDSAVYYCALRPTVTGNTKTLNKNLWSKDNTILASETALRGLLILALSEAPVTPVRRLLQAGGVDGPSSGWRCGWSFFFRLEVWMVLLLQAGGVDGPSSGWRCGWSFFFRLEVWMVLLLQAGGVDGPSSSGWRCGWSRTAPLKHVLKTFKAENLLQCQAVRVELCADVLL